MASPVVASLLGTNVTTAADPWASVNIHSGTINPYDILCLFVRASGGNPNTPSGWSVISAPNQDDASDDWSAVYGKRADGTEASTLSLDMTASVKGATLCYRITGGARLGLITAILVMAYETGAGANFDPSAISPGSTKDWLYLVTIGLDGETQTFTPPAGYAADVEANSGTGGAAATNVRISGSSKESTATSSDDPGAWTHAAPSSGVTAYRGYVAPDEPIDQHGDMSRARIWLPPEGCRTQRRWA